jgi:regulator of cell morphogenesis and NO signaling
LSGVVEVLTTLKVDLEEHLKTEEEELFPALTRAAGPEDIENPSPQRSRGELIESIEEDHEATGIILQEMKALTDNYTVPAWGCNSFRVLYEGLHDLEVDIHQHVHKENNILFPAVFGR